MRNLALGINDHLTNHSEAINLRLQRAKSIGEDLGEHGHHPLGEVHGITSINRLLIKRTANLDVMTDVSNGHPESKPQPFRFTINCIIEVSGILAVNSDKS